MSKNMENNKWISKIVGINKINRRDKLKRKDKEMSNQKVDHREL
jgi:hypothetical protein